MLKGEVDMEKRYVSQNRGGVRGEAINKKIIIGLIFIIPTALMLAIMQTSVLKIFGAPPGLTLLFTCAIGMVLGEREAETGCVSLRTRREGELGAMSVEEVVKKMQNEVENKIV